jgi:multidrug efflux pump subunit AcrA (membrane-fusion protein)
MAAAQREKDRSAALRADLIKAGTALQQTKMQTDAQKEIASQQVGATTRGQDIQKAIAEGRLNLDRDTYKLNVKSASANIRKTEQETAKLINETATSDKKFVTAMKQLSMGPANLLVELTMRHNGIALNDKSFMSLPVKKREAILAQILALSSSTYTEGKGVEALGSGAAESSLVDSFLDLLPFDTESEMTLPEQRRPSLGRRGRGAGSWNR